MTDFQDFGDFMGEFINGAGKTGVRSLKETFLRPKEKDMTEDDYKDDAEADLEHQDALRREAEDEEERGALQAKAEEELRSPDASEISVNADLDNERAAEGRPPFGSPGAESELAKARESYSGACGYCGRPGRSGDCYEGPMDTKSDSGEDDRCPGCGYKWGGLETLADLFKNVPALFPSNQALQDELVQLYEQRDSALERERDVEIMLHRPPVDSPGAEPGVERERRVASYMSRLKTEKLLREMEAASGQKEEPAGSYEDGIFGREPDPFVWGIPNAFPDPRDRKGGGS